MISLWEQQELLRADIVIVGGGIVGLWCALECCRRYPNRRVLLIERATLPLGASTRNAGFATIGTVGESLVHAQQVGDERVAALMVERWLGIQQWRQEFGDTALGYEPVGGYEWIFAGDEHVRAAVDRWNELLREVFAKEVFQDRPELIRQWGLKVPDLKSVIVNPYDGAFNTGKGILSLQQHVLRAGALFWSGTLVEAVEPTSTGVSVTCWEGVGMRRLTVRAHVVAVCTNAWIPDLVQNVDIRPARAQVLLTAPLSQRPFPEGTYHFHAGYYYFRWVGARLLLGGGRHRALQEEETRDFALNAELQRHLEEVLQTLLLPGQRVPIEQRWCGIMGMRPDRLPRVESVEERLVIGFGCNGMGLALAPRIGAHVATLVGDWLG